jgi:hypothetical protein
METFIEETTSPKSGWNKGKVGFYGVGILLLVVGAAVGFYFLAMFFGATSGQSSGGQFAKVCI